MSAGGGSTAFDADRTRMVDEQIARRGIVDERVLAAMRRVPRHLFVDEALRDRAYGDHALPIGEEQTISQPYIVALMTSLLRLTGQEKVLEIGTGSGYQTAVLAEIARRVCSIQRLAPPGPRALGLRCCRRFERMGGGGERHAGRAGRGAVRSHRGDGGRALGAPAAFRAA